MAYILIVDDTAEFRDAIADILQLEGFTVTHADSPDNAFVQMRLHRPELILSDLNFVGLDGLNFIEQVRANRSFATIPVIVVSGFSDVEHIKAALASGANDYLIKPFNITGMLESIQKVLRQCPPAMKASA